VTDPQGGQHAYTYDYRTRRIGRSEPGGATAVSWSGGLSLAEYPVSGLQGNVSNATSPTVEYRRGPDMGGGIGGLLHSLRNGTPKYNLGNGRGDVVAQSDATGALTWTASYEAFGKRPVETGTNVDRQRANTKEEDPTALLWEHFRYRDLETGVWLSRDPAGFVDGPNLYAYVRQNPWTYWDPEGLSIWTKLLKFAVKGGDFAATTAGLVSDFNSFKDSTTFCEAAPPCFSMLSEVLPVSIGDLKDGYKLAKNGIESLGDARSIDNVADSTREGGMKLNAASRKSESGHVGTGQKPKKENPYETAKTSQQKGAEGVALSREASDARGEKLRGGEVTLELPSGGRTKQDSLVITPEGRLKTIESKNGPKARETPRQLEYAEVQANGGTVIPRGKNAEASGLTPGKPIKIDEHQVDRWNKD
jgi:RHS repeat-associated protein